MQQIAAERRAEKYIADVIVEGINPNLTVFHAGKMTGADQASAAVA